MTKIHPNLRKMIPGICILLSLTACDSAPNHITLLDQLDLSEAITYYEGYDRGGNTSIAFDTSSSFKWSGEAVEKSGGFGYFLPDGSEVPYIKRDRDLGQTFTYLGEEKRPWQGLTLKLGYGSNVIRAGTYGKSIAVQFYEVSGEPVLNENGSTGEMNAFHGYPHDPASGEMVALRDDYWEGETYLSLGLITGFTFPGKEDFGFAPSDEIDPDEQQIKGKLLHFNFAPADQITLEPGKTYAFLIMLEEMGADVGFTLANHFHGDYPHGHGIRRDGRGIFPPPPANPSLPFSHPENKKAMESAHFPEDLQERAKISPGTNGYPDVDTWRDLYFVIH
ncbi:hypothetical protein [Algoriphagus namhaensis]